MLQRRFFLMICVLLPSLTVFAQANERPVVSVEHEDSRFKVDASIVLPVTPCVAYRFLTDYKSLPGYIPGMLQIREERISKNRVNVWQQGEVEVLFFHVKLVSSLEMEEIPEQKIIFRQVEGDLESYSGAWNLLVTDGGTKVIYNAVITLKPDQYMPAFLVKKVLENEVEKKFKAIAKEAAARKNKASPGCAVK